MNLLKTNLRSILITALLLAGIIVAVLLVQNQQIFKSRADVNKIRVVGSDGAEASYENNKFVTTSESITIGIQKDAVKNGLFNRPK